MLKSPAREKSILAPYAVAVLVTVAGLLLRFQFLGALERGNPFILFYPAVAVAAWYGGFGPGLVSTLLSAVAAAFFILAPTSDIRVASPADLLGLGVFTGMGALISGLAERAHAARRSAEQSADQLQESEAALRTRAAELAESNRQKDEFLAMLAHELRNPLAATTNSMAILERATPDDPAWCRALAVAQRQTQHQSRIVDDLLDVARMTRGTMSLRKERLDLAQLLTDVADDYRPRAEAAGLSLRLESSASPVWVTVDCTRMAQVLGNLLDNAIKFTPPGGTLTVRLTADPEHARATVSVEDTGMGIAPDLLDHVFEPFVQADRSLDRTAGGLGLGLPLVKGLVELNGGEVTVESAGLSQGAAFRVTLATHGPPARTPEPVTAERPRSARSVLIIEDNEDAAETLRDLLEIAGYEVEVAYNGPVGLEAAQRFRPQVVLCDLGLPGMDGYTVAAELRRRAELSPVRIIAVTGYGEAEARRRSREAGFDLHLTKPIDPDTLLQSLTASPSAN